VREEKKSLLLRLGEETQKKKKRCSIGKEGGHYYPEGSLRGPDLEKEKKERCIKIKTIRALELLFLWGGKTMIKEGVKGGTNFAFVVGGEKGYLESRKREALLSPREKNGKQSKFFL